MQVLYELETHVVSGEDTLLPSVSLAAFMSVVCGMLCLSCALSTRQFISPHTLTSTSRNSLQHAETQRQESRSHTEWSGFLTHQSPPHSCLSSCVRHRGWQERCPSLYPNLHLKSWWAKPGAFCRMSKPHWACSTEEVQISSNGLDADGCVHDNSPRAGAFCQRPVERPSQWLSRIMHAVRRLSHAKGRREWTSHFREKQHGFFLLEDTSVGTMVFWCNWIEGSILGLLNSSNPILFDAVGYFS